MVNKDLIEKVTYMWYENNKPKRDVVDKYIGKLVINRNGERYLITGTKPYTKVCQGDTQEKPRIVNSYALLIGNQWVEWFDFVRNYNRLVK